MKKIYMTLWALTSLLDVDAQSIECRKISTVETADVGQNEAAITFVSTQGDWVIKPVVKHGVNDKPMRRTAISGGKQYSYEYVADVTRDRERTFILTRQGSPLSEQCVAKGLRRGTRVSYSLQEVADTLERIEIQETGAKGVYPKEGMACVELTTTIDDLQVHTAWQKNVEKTENGAIKITVLVSVVQLQDAKARMDSLAAVQEGMENRGEYEHLDEVMQQADKWEQWYNERSVVVIGGNGIKELPLNIADISQKEKRRYAVIALQESYEDMLKRARGMRSERNVHLDYGYYDAACITYDKAIAHKDAKTAELEQIRTERNEMAAIRKLVWLMNRAQELADKAETEKGFNDPAVYKNLLARYNIIGKLRKEYPDLLGLDVLANQTHARLEQHPMVNNITKIEVTKQRQVITGKVVAGKNFYLSVPNLVVYKVSWGGKVRTDTPKTEIGRINADGTFSIVLPDDTHYIYIQGEKQSRAVYANSANMGTIVLGEYR